MLIVYFCGLAKVSYRDVWILWSNLTIKFSQETLLCSPWHSTFGIKNMKITYNYLFLIKTVVVNQLTDEFWYSLSRLCTN